MVLGIFTHFWTPAEGRVKAAAVVSAGTYSGQRPNRSSKYARIGGSYGAQSVSYSYFLGGEVYSSGLICLCVPIAVLEHPLRHGDTVTVYVAPYLHGVSVLIKGPDFFAFFFTAFLGFAFWYLARMVATVNGRSVMSDSPDGPSS